MFLYYTERDACKSSPCKHGVLAKISEVVISALAKIITLEKTVKVSSVMVSLIL